MPLAYVLIAIRRLIDEIGWTQGAYARDADGNVVGYADPSARCFCFAGAMCLVANWIGADVGVIGGRLLAAAGTKSLSEWNDAEGRTKEEVLAVLDRAIAAST